jgi:hypothetical protein
VRWLLLAVVGCAAPRFDIAGDSVSDHRTGLAWRRQPTPAEDWEHARADCAQWGGRLPTLVELKSLVDERFFAPTIDGRVFPGTPAAWFWTAEPFPGTTRFAWGVSFEYGGQHYLYRERLHVARCVK